MKSWKSRLVLLVATAILVQAVSGTNCKCSGSSANLSTAVPNILLLSDSIGATGTGYMTNVVNMLGPNSAAAGSGKTGSALVQHSGGGWTGMGGYCGTSFGVVECSKPWLGAAKFNVIHFNWGLHDIAPGMYANVTREEYLANLETLYGVLKGALAPNGTLIWTTTTPVPPSYKARNNSDVVAINELAATLFGPKGKYPEVQVHDLYTQVVERCNRDPGSQQYPTVQDCFGLQNHGVHFGAIGRQFTAIMTAASIIPWL